MQKYKFEVGDIAAFNAGHKLCGMEVKVIRIINDKTVLVGAAIQMSEDNVRRFTTWCREDQLDFVTHYVPKKEHKK